MERNFRSQRSQERRRRRLKVWRAMLILPALNFRCMVQKSRETLIIFKRIKWRMMQDSMRNIPLNARSSRCQFVGLLASLPREPSPWARFTSRVSVVQFDCWALHFDLSIIHIYWRLFPLAIRLFDFAEVLVGPPHKFHSILHWSPRLVGIFFLGNNCLRAHRVRWFGVPPENVSPPRRNLSAGLERTSTFYLLFIFSSQGHIGGGCSYEESLLLSVNRVRKSNQPSMTLRRFERRNLFIVAALAVCCDVAMLRYVNVGLCECILNSWRLLLSTPGVRSTFGIKNKVTIYTYHNINFFIF